MSLLSLPPDPLCENTLAEPPLMDALIRTFDWWEDKLIRFLVLTWVTRGAALWVPALVTAVILLFEARR
jgi:hypothetical protein